MKLVASINKPLSERKFLRTEKVRELLGYNDTAALMQAARAAGIPFVKINGRRILWDEDAVNAWLESRTVGGVQS
jgi:predicted DNA-binding transcriptional regulator AlpA